MQRFSPVKVGGSWAIEPKGVGWVFERTYPTRWKANLALTVWLQGGRPSDYFAAAREESEARRGQSQPSKSTAELPDSSPQATSGLQQPSEPSTPPAARRRSARSGLQMDPVDVDGTIYSARGLRFGGFRTDEFLAATSALEARAPGARARIVAEAHHTCYWLHRFCEVAFLLAVVGTRSLWIGGLAFLAAYVFEFTRFYLYGTSAFVAHVSWAWQWLKVPAFVAGTALLWPQSPLLAAVLIVFLILQGWLSLLSTFVLLPLRFALGIVVMRTLGRSSPQAYNMEGMALTWAINRRRTEERQHSNIRPRTSTAPKRGREPDGLDKDVEDVGRALTHEERVRATVDFFVPYLFGSDEEADPFAPVDPAQCPWCGPPPPGPMPPHLVTARSYCEALRKEGGRTCPKCGSLLA